MSEKELKIREVCGDYALDIPFADGSVNTIYFNSKRNAENVKRIIEIDGSKPNHATVCEMEEIRHGKWNLKKIFVVVLGLLAQTAINTSLWQNIDCTHIVPIAVQKWR